MLYPHKLGLKRMTELRPTPGLITGPYFPIDPDPIADNDLIERPGSNRVAKGTQMRVDGHVLSQDGEPIRNAVVEAWQCDAHGIYPHPDAPNHVDVDPDFEGYGRSTTGKDGTYSFRALRPVKYPGRAPHLHLKVTARGFSTLITQMYVAGEIENDTDFALHKIENVHLRSLLVAELHPTPKLKEDFEVQFTIVLERENPS